MTLAPASTDASLRPDCSNAMTIADRIRSAGVKVVDHGDHRLIVGGPVPPQAAAITFGRTIIVRRASAGNKRLLSHELVHVRQFRELGTVQFMARYVGSYLANRCRGHGHMAAYRRIPLEIEASWDSVAPTASTSLGAKRSPSPSA